MVTGLVVAALAQPSKLLVLTVLVLQNSDTTQSGVVFCFQQLRRLQTELQSLKAAGVKGQLENQD